MFSTSVNVVIPPLTSSKLHSTLFWLAVLQAERNRISLSTPSQSRWDSRHSHNCTYRRTGHKLPERTSRSRGEGTPLSYGHMESGVWWLLPVLGRSQQVDYCRVVCESGRRTWHSRRRARQGQKGRKNYSNVGYSKQRNVLQNGSPITQESDQAGNLYKPRRQLIGIKLLRCKFPSSKCSNAPLLLLFHHVHSMQMWRASLQAPFGCL